MRMSSQFTKSLREDPKDEDSINARLLTRGGFVRKLSAGVYSFLPMGLAVLRRIEDIVREEMARVGAEEVLMPNLTPAENWRATGRWDSMDEVFFKLKGAGDRDFALGPTHEEIVTPLVGEFIASYRDLPVAAYQIQTKFRNEARAKSGLLRGREFRMKDLYSFHDTESDLDAYYHRVMGAYDAVFKRCGIGEVTYLTYASGGHFCKYSHEYQMVTPYGEDIVHICDSCRVAVNKEIIDELGHRCPQCSAENLRTDKAVEVGNIFKLYTRYSAAFGLGYTDMAGNRQDEIFMGCYGIGTTRLIGAIVEALHDADGIVWPAEIAPYSAVLINLGPADAACRAFCDGLYADLQRAGIDVLYDDRDTRGGAKHADADLTGIPYQLVVGPREAEAGQVTIKTRASGARETVSRAAVFQAF